MDPIFKQIEQHMKFGGIEIRTEVPIEDINDFILNLPEDKHNSWSEIIQILEAEELITIE